MPEVPVPRKIVRFYKADPPTDTPFGNLPAVAGQRSEIDKMGMGTVILQMRAKGLTYQDIAVQTGFSVTQVGNWLAKYHEMEPEDRVNVIKNSIFNIEERLEEINTKLRTMLEDLENQAAMGGTMDRHLYNATLKNLMTAVGMAGDFMEKVAVFRGNERLKDSILETLKEVDEALARRVIKKLSEKREMIAALRPL